MYLNSDREHVKLDPKTCAVECETYIGTTLRRA